MTNSFLTRKNNSIIEDEGVFYTAYGQKAFSQCLVSAGSLRKACSAKSAIFTENTHEAKDSGLFDYVFPLEPFEELKAEFIDTNRLASLKLFSLLKSPFDRTLYIDSDTYVMGDILQAFKLLKHFDLMLTSESATEVAPSEDGSGRVKHLGLRSLQAENTPNAGVFAYSSTKLANDFVEAWVAEFIGRSRNDRGSGNWAGLNDQIVLREIFRTRRARKLKANIGFLPNYEYNITGRMAGEIKRIGLDSTAKILHAPRCAELVQAGKSIDEIFC